MSTGLDLEAIAEALADRLSQVAGIRQAWPHIPDRVPQVPAVYVGFADPVTYHRRFTAGAAEAEVTVSVIVGRPNEAEAQTRIRRIQSAMPLEDPVDEYPSIPAAIAADRTLDGTCGAALVTRSENPHAIDVAGTAYIAVDFTILVHT